MTYCVGVRLDEGLVFLADSRTNAGVDHIGTFRKLNVFENAKEDFASLQVAKSSIARILSATSESSSASGHSETSG